MLYTHGQEILSREQLTKIPVTERGTRSEQWQGLNHGTLANTIVKQILASQIEIKAEGWYTNPDKSAMWGALDLVVPEHKLDIGQAASFSLGVRHSNAGAYAVSFAVGARIAVCSNGLFCGDFLLKRKHTTGLELDGLVSEGIKRYIDQLDSVQHFVEALQGRTVLAATACELILATAEGQQFGCVNFRHLEDVYKAWAKPPHEEFEGRTAWSLYNAFTEMGKKLSPPRQMRMLQGIKPAFESVLGLNFGIARNATPIEAAS